MSPSARSPRRHARARRSCSPPGPWPTDIVGAANPLAGTPFLINGANATGNADLRIWLPAGRRRLTTLTTTATKNVVVEGRLASRDNRGAIVGATVTVVTQNVHAPEWTPVINLVTDAQGRFAARVGAGYHRRFAVIYYPAVTSVSPLYSRRVLVRTRSSVKLARPYHKGRSYRFDGSVSAGFFPFQPVEC